MKANTINKSSLFLVSGGAKGITAQCVLELAQRHQCGFILVGRSEYSDEPEPSWAAGAEDKRDLNRQAMEYLASLGEEATPKRVKGMSKAVLSRREIGNTLRAIEDAGGRAVYLSADVTDLSSLEPGLQNALQKWAEDAKITGLIHGAGVLADKPIQKKTAKDFNLVYSVKVNGLQNLLSCTEPENLEHLVLFSSVAAFYGNVGQADYAMANEVLNKFAHQFQRDYPACHVLALNWGAWDGGMVTPALKRLLTRRGIDLIPPDVGPQILAGQLAAKSAEDAQNVQLIVGPPLAIPANAPGEELRTHRVRRRLTLQANPFLHDHVIGGQAVLPSTAAVAWVGNTCEQLYPGYKFFRTENYKALKGILFNETLANEYLLELTETAKNAEEISLDALIQSQTEDGKSRYHYSVEITLRQTLPEPPLLDNFTLEESTPIPGERLYEKRVLFHGPAFQGIQKVLNLDERGLTTLCEVPEVSQEVQGQFPVQTFNLFASDAALQGMLIWANDRYGYGGLPLKMEKGVQYQPIPVGEQVYSTMRVVSSSKSKLVSNVIIHNAQGRVYSQLNGIEITLSERLNQLFAQNSL